MAPAKPTASDLMARIKSLIKAHPEECAMVHVKVVRARIHGQDVERQRLEAWMQDALRCSKRR